MLERFWADEDAATMVEYGFMILLIATACVGAIVLFGQGVNGLFTSALPWP
jgi:Flp pilus assembly pilin Flp